MWLMVPEMMLKMVRMVMLGFSGWEESSLSFQGKGQNFGDPSIEGEVCSPETWILVRDVSG